MIIRKTLLKSTINKNSIQSVSKEIATSHSVKKTTYDYDNREKSYDRRSHRGFHLMSL